LILKYTLTPKREHMTAMASINTEEIEVSNEMRARAINPLLKKREVMEHSRHKAIGKRKIILGWIKGAFTIIAHLA